MAESKNTKAQQLLNESKSILLVDWPNINLPYALLKAGFIVFSYSPDKYTEATIVIEQGKEQLTFNEINGAPGNIDIVNIFRPEEEHEGIFKKHILPSHAKIVWLQPPVISAIARDLAAAHNLEYVEGVAIADVTAKI